MRNLILGEVNTVNVSFRQSDRELVDLLNQVEKRGGRAALVREWGKVYLAVKNKFGTDWERELAQEKPIYENLSNQIKEMEKRILDRLNGFKLVDTDGNEHEPKDILDIVGLDL